MEFNKQLAFFLTAEKWENGHCSVRILVSDAEPVRRRPAEAGLGQAGGEGLTDNLGMEPMVGLESAE